MTDNQWTQVRETFQKLWGYEDFRYPQGEIVRSLLQHQDALVVLPTGGGKSICFQLPALLQTGLTLVISPLVALMENQVKELRDRRLPATALHSEIPRFQTKEILQGIAQNRFRLLYLSPETLLSPKVWEILTKPEIAINGLILDEAHCLVQWGDTFRPAYRRLGAVREALLKCKPAGTRIPVAAFTATADPAAQQTIRQVLQLKSPQLFLQNPYRANLALTVRIAWTPRGRKQQLHQFIQAHPRQTGLIYARTRQDTERLANQLRDAGYATAAYHAGLSPQERRSIENLWLEGKLPFVVCTSAFGMGVNKSNVRWVVHFQAPALLSEYVQEVGRAGRDGKPASVLTLVSEPTGILDPTDKQRWDFFQERGRSQIQRARQLAKKLPPQGNILEVSRQYPDSPIALSVLHSTGQLQWIDPFRYRILPAKTAPTANLDAAKQMAQYLNTRYCRWQFLLQAFGFGKEARGLRCGKCDRCRE
ncbi:MAG TPA: ATP-dependent DNA helicase RecQ [Oscillatoriales cyanobacterium M59_W2019_021]|nr:MAG: ATP-dependent DNA helicase RecQ [Cyanobacteria bacterium J055]HIK31449.1 ATP-dependent DNA helicase RecQ [Oscillatoriales cyanobacterium M4454_W2019_049]HIK53293.1 ATP-dependent DNA helicase RecQ [Oscillatoriales cyanobacterium M59_W2019_021]